MGVLPVSAASTGRILYTLYSYDGSTIVWQQQIFTTDVMGSKFRISIYSTPNTESGWDANAELYVTGEATVLEQIIQLPYETDDGFLIGVAKMPYSDTVLESNDGWYPDNYAYSLSFDAGTIGYYEVSLYLVYSRSKQSAAQDVIKESADVSDKLGDVGSQIENNLAKLPEYDNTSEYVYKPDAKYYEFSGVNQLTATLWNNKLPFIGFTLTASIFALASYVLFGKKG